MGVYLEAAPVEGFPGDEARRQRFGIVAPDDPRLPAEGVDGAQQPVARAGSGGT
jgi:hypothetical protein